LPVVSQEACQADVFLKLSARTIGCGDKPVKGEGRGKANWNKLEQTGTKAQFGLGAKVRLFREYEALFYR